VRGTPESKAGTEKDYRFDTMGVLTFMVTMVALQVLATQGSEIGWTSPITLAWVRPPSSLRAVLQGRDQSPESVRELCPLPQLHIHGSDDLEFFVERGCRVAVGVDDARAARRRPVGSGSGDADNRLCHRDRRLHPRRREAVAAVRCAQADDLGTPDCRAVDRDADTSCR
jgi:hypothetical protein